MRRDDLKKVCNPVSCQCQIQLFAMIDSHTIIAKQKCDDQIWMTGREIFARDNPPTIKLNLM
jgi:hypothetical protein